MHVLSRRLCTVLHRQPERLRYRRRPRLTCHRPLARRPLPTRRLLWTCRQRTCAVVWCAPRGPSRSKAASRHSAHGSYSARTRRRRSRRGTCVEKHRKAHPIYIYIYGRPSAAQAADWPRLAEAPGSLRYDLALRGASGEPAGRSMCHPVFDIAGHVKAPCPPWPSSDA